ncbi:MAG: hypothetical protein GXY17_08005 [Clostridiaceae bacterium]|jgi:hypothetical protein|nr:hypothetical protein [Clostridiaceae bacterium]
MFGKKKGAESRYIIAVKDYEKTLGLLKEGKISLPYDRAIYSKMLDSQSMKVDNLKSLNKFIRANGKSSKEVGHYWEGLIVDGYTLVNVEYLEKIPAMDHVCNNDIIKYVCNV